MTGSHGAHILVVEDCKVNSAILCAMLDGLGHTAVEADDGAQALERFGEHGFDLVLMDLSMPHVDGFEATRRIRSAEALRERAATPVIATTTIGLAECGDRCRDAGFDDYLAKPVDLQELRACIDKWMRAQVGDLQEQAA